MPHIVASAKSGAYAFSRRRTRTVLSTETGHTRLLPVCRRFGPGGAKRPPEILHIKVAFALLRATGLNASRCGKIDEAEFEQRRSPADGRSGSAEDFCSRCELPGGERK